MSEEGVDSHRTATLLHVIYFLGTSEPQISCLFLSFNLV